MNCFVDYGSGLFATNRLLPDMDPEEGDVAFQVAWAEADGVLIGLFIVGEPEQRPEDPLIVPAASFRLPALPLPRHLLPEPPHLDERIPEVGRRLYPVDDDVGRTLLKIAQDHLGKKKLPLSLGQRRNRAKRQKAPGKTPEELVKEIEKKARPRPGQMDFREALLLAYDGRCAISGCNVDAALSAAHILDYSKSECQEAWNGILLRADLHLLFDRHLLRIFPGNPPVVMLDEETRESEAYKQFHLHMLRLSNAFDERTSRELRRRWEAANQEFGRFPDPPQK